MLILIISCLWSFFVHSTEANLSADKVSTDTILENGKKQILLNAEGAVVLESSDFTINTEKMTVNNVTKVTTLPEKAKILYHKNEPITIFSDYLTGNPDKKILNGNGISMKSDIVSYKAKTVNFENDIASFQSAKFSTCELLKDDGTQCSVPWNGAASNLEYNYKTKILRAKNFRFNLYGVPVFYLPYLKLNLNKQKNGLQKFMLITANAQQGVTFDYLKYTKNYGDFTLRPELYLNQNSQMHISRVHNLSLLHNYTSQDGSTANTSVKIAPNAGTQNSDGTASTQKVTRYFLQNDINHMSDNSAFVSSLNVASDRFFRQIYNLKFENYLTSSVNYANYTGERFYNLNATHYRAVTANNQTTIPSVITSAKYNKTLKNYNGYILGSENEALTFYRINGTRGTRINNGVTLRRFINVGGFSVDFNPVINMYNYVYSGTEKPQTYASRLVGDVNAKISKPFTYFVGKYILETKPILFLDYTSHVTHNEIVNEDSFANFITDTNVLLPSRYNGSDLIDDGFKIAYGMELQLQDLQNNKFNFFVAQRYNTIENVSNVVGRAGFTFSKVDFSSRFIINKENGNLLFSNSRITMKPVHFLEASVGYFFLDRSLQSNVIANIRTTQNIMYSGKLKYGYHYLFGNVVQNPNFIGSDNIKKNMITEITSGIGYERDCLNYRIGLQKRLFFTGTQNLNINSLIFELKIQK